jgi:hypothetical protein
MKKSEKITKGLKVNLVESSEDSILSLDSHVKKFRTLRDLLNYFLWNPDYDFGKVEIEYIDRPKGISLVKGENVKEIGHKFIYLIDGTPLPMHRIVRVIYGGEEWWKKR